MKKLLFFAPIILLLFSCEKNDSKDLAIREKALSDRERLFEQKEADYETLLKMRDSLMQIKKPDSVIISQWPQNIAGRWTGKVICTESNCSDYVVGDQRSDIWEFDSDSTQLYTKILNNNNLVRLYSGKFENNEAKLNFKTDSSAKKKVEMNVILNEFSSGRIRGVRTVAVDDCLAKFSVDLQRAEK